MTSVAPVPPAIEFAESFVPPDPATRAAMERAVELGTRPVGPGTGAVLRLLAAAAGARAVVEIGTGTGASGLWLLGGMRADGVLTTIDVDGDRQRLARRAFAEAGFAPSRTRIIAGQAREVLPRLADGAYDLVFVDADTGEYAICVSAAHRLLRPGGLLVLHRALGHEARVADPMTRDAETVTMRELLRYLQEADEWLPALLAVGDGLLSAVKR